MTKPPIRAIFCDLGNVLTWFVPRPDRLWNLAQLFRPQLGGDLASRERFFAALESSGVIGASDGQPEGGFDALDTGRVSRQQLYQAFLLAAGVTEGGVPPERFWSGYTCDLQAIPETCQLMQSIQRQGVAIIAATNGDVYSPDLITLQTGLRFDGVVMSWQIGCKKPDPRFYQACLESAAAALGQPLTPGNCLLIDDRADNHEGFRQFGGHGILFSADRRPSIRRRQTVKLIGQLHGQGISFWSGSPSP